MLASVVFIGAVLCSAGFMAWIVFFVLNRGFNTTLEMGVERRRVTRNYLVFGALLLIAAVALGVAYSKLPPPLLSPELGPGMPQTHTPALPGPSMDKTLIAGGIVLSGVAFLLWLGAFLINRSFSTAMRSARDDRRSAGGQLVFGALLLGVTAFFVAVYFQKPPAADAPGPAAGQTVVKALQAPKEQAEAAKAAVEKASNVEQPEEEPGTE